MQNRQGLWVPAIPDPYHGLIKIQCTECGRWFLIEETYRGHYALQHILELD